MGWLPPPELWQGRAVAILACGPSLTPELASRTAGCVRIAINRSWELAPDAEMVYAADSDFWKAYPEALACTGIKVCAQSAGPEVRYSKPLYSGGGNSALHSAYLARHAGAARILLLGVDLNDGQLTHWHGRHERGLRNPTNAGFARAREAWGRFAALEERPEVINCNPNSALTCFPIMPLEAALDSLSTLPSSG